LHRSSQNLFSDPNTLRQIVSNIVIPNIAVRESDVEQFEDDPSDYILADMEGSDSETRRRCSIDLLRAMCRNYEQQATAIVKEHLQTLITNFTNDPGNNWGQKDAAILLVLAVSVRKESALGGVSEVNDQLDVMEFFTSQILPELNEPNMSARPMLKADAVKFVSTFRNQFTVEVR
jgi:exportin-2 (importin alpha re-exporter)